MAAPSRRFAARLLYDDGLIEESWALDPNAGQISLGRQPANSHPGDHPVADLLLSRDLFPDVSRQHATLTCTDEGWRIAPSLLNRTQLNPTYVREIETASLPPCHGYVQVNAQLVSAACSLDNGDAVFLGDEQKVQQQPATVK